MESDLDDGDMTAYDLFNGFVEAWPATWEGAHRQGNDRVRVDAVDAFKILNLADLTIDRGQELSGARVEAVLDAISWPTALRDIDAGQSQVQAISTTTGALAHIQEVANSESGIFFIAKDGIATFYDRFHTTLLDEDDDLWGDETGEKHYAQITTSYDDSQIWNEVVVTAPSLADQTASDANSQSTFGGPAQAPRTLTISTLLTSTGDMLDRADFLLTKYKEPHFRITSLMLDNASLDDTQWPRILPKDLHDRILVRKRPAGDLIEQPSFIEGSQISVGPGRWQVTWTLSSTALQQGQWELGTVGKSELGVTTTLVSV